MIDGPLAMPQDVLPDLFDRAETTPADGGRALRQAESLLLDLADYAYAHTSLKPMSKTLFMLSRCLFAIKFGGPVHDARSICAAYQDAQRNAFAAPSDDFNFETVVAECGSNLAFILGHLSRIAELTSDTDSLGLAFDTLLRGKWESGEGLGTFLTPEEIVRPMVRMAFKALEPELLARVGLGTAGMLFGDTCGGTGRFVRELARSFTAAGVPRQAVSSAARLFDQSLMAVDLARLNFMFDGYEPEFSHVSDSLTSATVTALRGRFALIATNPPFGSGKYRYSEALARAFPSGLLSELGVQEVGASADPSELFFFGNLGLLAPGGVLAIVLPDGVLQSERFVRSLRRYELECRAEIDLVAVVSLPPVTFSLGGTVAKTSFVVARVVGVQPPGALYMAHARHVGFTKKGNRRAADPRGNELDLISEEFLGKGGPPVIGTYATPWRNRDRLGPVSLLASVTSWASQSQARLGNMVEAVRTTKVVTKNDVTPHFHVSVLDVDETGLIDVVAATRNKPITPGLRCQPGDVLLSCMNPKIWRVAVVPDLGGLWSCSSEFLVLRPRHGHDAWAVALALHHESVIRAVRSLAGGTSSSRQRVPKAAVIEVPVPSVESPVAELHDHARWRVEYYATRLREAAAYERLHAGALSFRV